MQLSRGGWVSSYHDSNHDTIPGGYGEMPRSQILSLAWGASVPAVNGVATFTRPAAMHPDHPHVPLRHWIIMHSTEWLGNDDDLPQPPAEPPPFNPDDWPEHLRARTLSLLPEWPGLAYFPWMWENSYPYGPLERTTYHLGEPREWTRPTQFSGLKRIPMAWGSGGFPGLKGSYGKSHSLRVEAVNNQGELYPSIPFNLNVIGISGVDRRLLQFAISQDRWPPLNSKGNPIVVDAWHRYRPELDGGEGVPDPKLA